MKKDIKKVKVGIVGAGLTGLIAAKVLSEKGVQVSVFEKKWRAWRKNAYRKY